MKLMRSSPTSVRNCSAMYSNATNPQPGPVTQPLQHATYPAPALSHNLSSTVSTLPPVNSTPTNPPIIPALPFTAAPPNDPPQALPTSQTTRPL